MSPQARGGSMEGPGSRAEMPQVQALVVWESPSPIGLALKKTPSPELSKSYVITVAGFPLHERNSEASRGNEGLEQVFKEGTSLQRKGQDPIVPDKVEIADNAGVSFIRFTFPRDPKPISLEDKDVEFVTSLGRTSLKTKFSLKDMTYKGQLAL